MTAPENANPANPSGPAIHATAVSIGGVGVIITGPSGSGKSDLAIRLIDRGAVLIADDYVCIEPSAIGPILRCPENITGKIELRGVGIIERPFAQGIVAQMHIALGAEGERLPLDMPKQPVGDITLPTLAMDAFHSSSPIKAEISAASLQARLDPPAAMVAMGSANVKARP